MKTNGKKSHKAGSETSNISKAHEGKWQDLIKELKTLSSEELHKRALYSVQLQNEHIASGVAAMSEILRRRDYLASNTSIYRYAKTVLGLSDGSAQRRAVAARLALEFPETIEKIAKGTLSLDGAMALWVGFQNQRRQAQETSRQKSTVSQAASQTLSQAASQSLAQSENELGGKENPSQKVSVQEIPSPREASCTEKKTFIQEMEGKSRSEILQSLAKMNENLGLTPDHLSERPKGHFKPLSKNWTELKVVLDPERLSKLKHLQNLLSRQVPSGDLNQVFDLILDQMLDQVDPERKELRIQKRKAQSAQTRKAKENLKENLKDDFGKNIQESAEKKLKANSEKNTKEIPEKNHAALSPRNEGEDLLRQKKLILNTPTRELQRIRDQVWGEGVMILLKNNPRPKKAHPRTEFSADVNRAARILAQNRCEWVDMRTGRRCEERRFLELDHIVKVRDGGESFAWNSRCLCRFHNINREKGARGSSFRRALSAHLF
jgi:hypothetical protein